MQYNVSERRSILFICTGARDAGAVRARCVRRNHAAQFHAGYQLDCTMADWSMFDADWPTRPYHYNYPYPYYEYDEKEQPHAQPLPQELSPTLTCTSSPPQQPAMIQAPTNQMMPIPNKITPRGDNPREIRNKAEKQRRDKLNQSIAELAAMVPPVVASCRKIDKTGVLRLTAHYLRAHQYVFDESTPAQHDENFKQSSADCLLGLLNGFLLTTTYRGLMVVVSQNMTKYLGYSEVDLFGQSVFSITHEEDHNMLREQLMPQPHLLGPHGELLVPDEPNGQKMVEEALAKDHRRFIIRFKKHGQRSEPPQYVTCHMEGSFRKSDRACRGFNRSCQFVRRARARSDNPCSSGNDVVFIGVVRPMIQTFVKENQLETFRMEYRTRHLIDGEIIQCEQRIALVTGYMTNEVKGVNAMNFMHKEDVQLVIIALRDMYVKKRLFGESCYRLITKNGQFIYMRTRGCLDVDKQSRSVTTFVCTNTVVGEREGKHLIKLMKKRYAMEAGQIGEIKDEKAQQSEIESLGIKDPRLLEKDILHLVSDLPSCSDTSVTEDNIGGFSHSLELIPPKRERIVSAIEKMYTVFKMFPKEPKMERDPESLSSSLDSLNRSTQTVKFLKPAVPSIIKNPASSKIIKKATSFEDTYMAPHTMQPDYEYNNTTAVIDVENYIFEDKSIQQSNFVKPKQDVNMGFTFTDPRPVTQTATSMAGVKYQRQTGMKRPIETVTCRSILKKKNNTNEDKELAVAGRCSPNFETFLDEAISCEDFLHLDTALASLEQTIDPNFPDLLSNEVQEILEQIEDPVNG